MITEIIAALIGNYMTTAFAIGVVVASIHVLAHRGPRTSEFISKHRTATTDAEVVARPAHV